MTEFVKREFLRLIDLLPQTDPRTNEYLTLLHSIECFDSIANSVDEIDKLRGIDLMGDRIEEQLTVEKQAEWVKEIADKGKVVPFTAPDFPDTPAETEQTEPELPKPKPPEEEKIDPSEVRKALVAARARGVDSKEILSGFGVSHFQELPASKYRALLDALEVI